MSEENKNEQIQSDSSANMEDTSENQVNESAESMDQKVNPSTPHTSEYRTERKEKKESELSELLYEPPVDSQQRKTGKKISLGAFLVSCIALMLAAVMVTYTCCNSVYKQRLAEAQLSNTVSGGDRYYPFELFDAMLEQYSFQELDKDAMMEAALKAYIEATGDTYAQYYTAEEYQDLMQSSAGNSEGIGVNIINTVVSVSGVEYKVFRVINVVKDSPAEEAGLKIGDMIYAAGIGENLETINSLGYDVALKKLQGATGTIAEFTVLRKNDSGYEQIPFEIVRGGIKTTSVYYHQSTLDPKVGVVKIIQFDLTTPKQFTEAVDTLKSSGCTKFVFDVRYNPGGDLASISAVLSYFLDEGDVIIRVKDKAGNEDVSRVTPKTYTGNYADCTVKQSDIGKYKDLNAVVLCNGSTASAAELFTATFRDYDIATIVGTTTFGKGSMQSVISLMHYGYNGALKLTTAMYFPASGEGYDGVGIVPDVMEELSEMAAEKNIYELTDEEDNQLRKALGFFK